MKTNPKATRLLKIVIAAALAIGATACGKIPEGYRGKFVDASTGDRLELKENEGILQKVRTARVLQSEAKDLDFNELNKAVAGIYVRQAQDNKDDIEIFWLSPRAETRRSEAGFTWMDSEVAYTRMNSQRKDKVDSIQMIHCDNGLIMLDEPTRNWNGGCPAGATRYDMRRTE